MTRSPDHRDCAITHVLSLSRVVVRPDVALNRPHGARLERAFRVLLPLEADPGRQERRLRLPADLTLEREAAAAADRAACLPDDRSVVAVRKCFDGFDRHLRPLPVRTRKRNT